MSDDKLRETLIAHERVIVHMMLALGNIDDTNYRSKDAIKSREAFLAALADTADAPPEDDGDDDPTYIQPPATVGRAKLVQCDKCGREFPTQIPAHRCSDPITHTPTGDQDLGETDPPEPILPHPSADVSPEVTEAMVEDGMEAMGYDTVSPHGGMRHRFIKGLRAALAAAHKEG